MKEDAVEMAPNGTQSGWLVAMSRADDMNPVISHSGLSRSLAEDLPTVIYENSILLEQNPSIVNVTREYPFEWAMIMFGYMLPFVLVITLITNSLVIIVLSQRHMRTPTNLVLMTMAMVDIGTMASPSPWYLYIYTFGNHNKFLFPPTTCYAHYVMTDVIPIFLHTSSIWLALLLAGQRYIYVCHPTIARTWCTKPRVKKAIYAILLVAFGHQTSHFFDNIFTPTKVHQNGKIQDACHNENAAWVRLIGENNYYLTYYSFRILFVNIVPCLALLALNILLFKALRRAEKKRTELLKRKFKLVGVQEAKSLQQANNRRSLVQANNFSTYDPSSYTLASRFASERDKPKVSIDGGAQTGLAAAAASGTHKPSCGSISELSQRTEPRNSNSHSAELEANSLRRPSTSSSRDESEVGDESSCAECAAWRGRRESPSCRPCSLDDTDTGLARDRHQHHHQSSQCSSIMGGATNEEDVSSLTNFHHHRCRNGSTFEHSEVVDRGSSMNNLDNSDGEAELNLSLNSSTSAARSALEEKLDTGGPKQTKLAMEVGAQKDDVGLIKSSSSAESRLAQYGCLLAHSKALRRVRMLGKSKLKAEAGCCRLSLIGKGSKAAKVRLWDRASSKTPASQPSICTTSGAQHMEESEKLTVGDCSALSEGPDQRPNSIHSFVRVRVEKQLEEGRCDELGQGNKRLFSPTGPRMKSPSFASSMGRASRASLAGPSGAPIALVPTAGHQTGRLMDSNRTTLMLVVVVTVFLIVEVPVAAVTIIHVVHSMFEVFHNMDIAETLNYIKLFSNFFIMLSYSINFTIYCSMSKKFRETFRDLFFWGRLMRKPSARMMYQTQAQPNEFVTITQAPGTFAQQCQLASPTSFEPDGRASEGGPLVGSARAHQRSNSLRPVRLYGLRDGTGGESGRLEEGAERQQCGSAVYSDYLATATTTLTTLDPRGSSSGQNPMASSGRLADNTSASSSPSHASVSSSATPATVSRAAAIKQHCKSMLNGGQPALLPQPQCQL